MSDGSARPGVPPTCMRSTRHAPRSGARHGPRRSPRVAGSFAKEPPFSTLFMKPTRALFHRVTEFASTTLPFTFFTVATSLDTCACTDAAALAPSGCASHTRPSQSYLRSRCSPRRQREAVEVDTVNGDVVPSSLPRWRTPPCDSRHVPVSQGTDNVNKLKDGQQRLTPNLPVMVA